MVSASGLSITGSSMVMSMPGSAARECPMRLPSPTRSIRSSAPGLPHRLISRQNPQLLLNEVLYATRVPTMIDRATQAIVKNALEPFWEARFEGSSYGFRPGRGCHDAIARIYAIACPNKRKRWVLDADVEGAFDHACWYPLQQPGGS